MTNITRTNGTLVNIFNLFDKAVFVFGGMTAKINHAQMENFSKRNQARNQPIVTILSQSYDISIKSYSQLSEHL